MCPKRDSRPGGRLQPQKPFGWSELFIVLGITGGIVLFLTRAVFHPHPHRGTAPVQVEIKNFESSIASFKTEFGLEPPSRMVLFETGDNWKTGDPSLAISNPEAIRSQTLLRRMCPQFDFTLDRDINGDGDMMDVIELTGAECLVFFLGGVTVTEHCDMNGVAIGPGGQPTRWTPVGFSKNPRDPFERGLGTPMGPFHEFDAVRFVDAGSDGMPEYLPCWPIEGKTPYLYLSSYDGRGYEPGRDSDINGDRQPDLALQLDINGDGNVDQVVSSVWMQAILDISRPLLRSAPFNGTSYQIIAAGANGEFGAPGVYGEAGISYPLPSGTTLLNRHAADDDITNFSSGRLRH